MKYFRIPVDNYYEAVAHTRKPKYASAFSSYTAIYHDTTAYVKGEVKEEYYEYLLQKDGVSEFSEEDYINAINHLT